MKLTAKVVYRLNPCDCGCKGQDPHHKGEYERVIRYIKDVELQTVRVGQGYTVQAKKEGFVRLPFSDKPVRVVASEILDTGRFIWYVDRDSISYSY